MKYVKTQDLLAQIKEKNHHKIPGTNIFTENIKTILHRTLSGDHSSCLVINDIVNK